MKAKMIRVWTLELNSDFDNHPPIVKHGPAISAYEGEVEVIEMSSYLSCQDHNAKLRQDFDKLSVAYQELKHLAAKLNDALETTECNCGERMGGLRKCYRCSMLEAYATFLKSQEENEG